MTDYRLELLIIKNRERLNKLIETDAEYSKILKQSIKLDKLITEKIARQINREQIYWKHQKKSQGI